MITPRTDFTFIKLNPHYSEKVIIHQNRDSFH